MKRYLLLFAATASICYLHAQESKETKKVTAYAITGVQKGSASWTEVRLVDVTTGEEIQSVYKSASQVDALNARTGKPIAKNDMAPVQEQKTPQVIQVVKKDDNGNVVTYEKRMIYRGEFIQDLTKPFATNSAALAYDKKHERLYYTPMGINQLRYIDLKSGKVFYFEGESFGVLKSRHDVENQITRMVIGSDGNGYALTNNGNHLIQFTTGKKPSITDLGALTDDAANGAFSVHSPGGYGGDVVADAKKNIYLVTANRSVFKISLESKVATFLGAIQGLPRGFTTNGVAVEGDSKIIVTSSTSTAGYFSVDLNTLQAEKLSTSNSAYNASDLANANLLFDKKKKKDKETVQPAQQTNTVKNGDQGKPMPTTLNNEVALQGSISAYPNPVVNGGTVKISFNNQPQGRYTLQFMDANGKIVSQQQVSISGKSQLVDFRVPQLITAGNYVIRVVNEANEIASVNKLIVQ